MTFEITPTAFVSFLLGSCLLGLVAGYTTKAIEQCRISRRAALTKARDFYLPRLEAQAFEIVELKYQLAQKDNTVFALRRANQRLLEAWKARGELEANGGPLPARIEALQLN